MQEDIVCVLFIKSYNYVIPFEVNRIFGGMINPKKPLKMYWSRHPKYAEMNTFRWSDVLRKGTSGYSASPLSSVMKEKAFEYTARTLPGDIIHIDLRCLPGPLFLQISSDGKPYLKYKDMVITHIWAEVQMGFIPQLSKLEAKGNSLATGDEVSYMLC